MTEHMPEIVSTWLANWSILAAMSSTMPPRDPNDDDDEDEDDDAEPDDDDEPAIVREPDE